MSCCNGPIVIKVQPYPPAECPDTPTYSFSNANLTGQGVFYDHTGTNVQFYGIASSGGTIDITLDAPNNTINLELDAEIIAGSFPDSTTVVKGKTAYSTNAEALAKTSTTKAVTPSNFAAMGASTTFAGFTEYATQAETQAGTSTVLAVTPDGLQSVVDTLLVTQSVPNAGARGTATPSATGQLLIQEDTGVLYEATSVAIGAWALAAVPLTGSANIEGLLLQMTGGDLSFAGAETITTMPWRFQAAVNFDSGANLGGIVNFDTTFGNLLWNDGVVIPANSVLITGGTAGQINSSLINTFLSEANPSSTYFLVDWTPSRTITDTATITLPELADVVATLISDLISTLKPVGP